MGNDAITAGILVGGRGTRMGGADKARLRRDDGTTYIEHIFAQVSPRVARVVLLGRADQQFDDVSAPVIPDRFVDSGPMGGLERLMSIAETSWVFLVACDMPAFEGSVIDSLFAQATERVDAVLPRTAEGLHPTCALYHRRTHAAVEAALDEGRRALFKMVQGWKTAEVAVDAGVLTNVNEPV